MSNDESQNGLNRVNKELKPGTGKPSRESTDDAAADFHDSHRALGGVDPLSADGHSQERMKDNAHEVGQKPASFYRADTGVFDISALTRPAQVTLRLTEERAHPQVNFHSDESVSAQATISEKHDTAPALDELLQQNRSDTAMIDVSDFPLPIRMNVGKNTREYGQSIPSASGADDYHSPESEEGEQHVAEIPEVASNYLEVDYRVHTGVIDISSFSKPIELEARTSQLTGADMHDIGAGEPVPHEADRVASREPQLNATEKRQVERVDTGLIDVESFSAFSSVGQSLQDRWSGQMLNAPDQAARAREIPLAEATAAPGREVSGDLERKSVPRPVQAETGLIKLEEFKQKGFDAPDRRTEERALEQSSVQARKSKTDLSGLKSETGLIDLDRFSQLKAALNSGKIRATSEGPIRQEPQPEVPGPGAQPQPQQAPWQQELPQQEPRSHEFDRQFSRQPEPDQHQEQHQQPPQPLEGGDEPQQYDAAMSPNPVRRAFGSTSPADRRSIKEGRGSLRAVSQGRRGGVGNSAGISSFFAGLVAWIQRLFRGTL